MIWILLFVCLINIFLTVFAVIKIPKINFIKNYFILFCFFTILWLLSNIALELTNLFFYFKLAYGIGALVLASAFIFTKSFSSQKKLPVFQILIIYGIGFLIFLLCIINNVTFIENNLTKSVTNTLFFNIYNVYIIFCLIYALVMMILSIKKFDGIIKTQAKFIFLGILFFGIHALFVSFVFPSFGINIYRRLDTCGSLYFVAFTLYAIIRYHFMDIEVIIKRSTIYAILITFTTAIYIAIIFIFENILASFIRYSSVITRIFAGIIIALTFLPIRNLIENFIDKVFFRQKIDYIQALTNLSQSLISMIDLRVLMNTIVKNIMDIMKIEKACLLLHDKNLKGYQAKAIAGFEDSLRGDLFFSTKNRIVLWIKNIKDIIIREIVEKYDDVDNIYRNSIINQMRELKLELIIPLFFDDHLIGLIVLGKKKNDNIFSQEELNILKSIGNQASIAFSNAIAYDDLKKIYLGTIEAFVKAIEAKDYYTKGHSERVVKIAMKIAKEMQISREQIELLQYAGVLHDIGKIGIDNEILRKPESLTDLEYIEIKKHPVIGKNIVQSIKFLEDTAKIILHHHERWDGGGYPHKLKKLGIPLLSRILCIADSFDAMTSNRPYRPAMTDSEAVEIIKKSSGKQFDPVVVKYFVALYEKNSLS